MTPESGRGPVSPDPQEKQLPEAWSEQSSTTHHSRKGGLQHVSHALDRLRNQLARAIATRDQVWSADISHINDRLQAENEDLREQLGRAA